MLAVVREAKLTGPHAASWVERLSPMREQLVESARVLVEHGEADKAAELAAGSWRVFHVLSDTTRGRAMLTAALAVGNARPSSARAMALYADGLLAFREGKQAESRARNEEALAVARAIGDRQVHALALVGLSRVALRDGDYARVRQLAAAARELVRDLDASADAAPLHLLAAGTRLAGDYDQAAKLYAESLELNRNLGDRRGQGMEHVNLGYVELHRGQIARAERHFADSDRFRNLDDAYEQATTHLTRAALAFAKGDRKRAATQLERGTSILEDAGIALDPDDAFEVQWLRDRLNGSVE